MDAVHRTARADFWVKAENGSVGKLLSQTIDQIYLCANRPNGTWLRPGYFVDDVLGAPSEIRGLHYFQGALWVNKDVDTRKLFSRFFDLLNREPLMNGTMPFP